MLSKREEVALEGGVSRAGVLYAMFLLISFFGWILEEVFFYMTSRGFADRGFLSFPICIVYGLGLLSCYRILGLPQKMRIFSFPLRFPSNRKQKLAKMLLYIALSGILCTVCELAVGVFMDISYGILMWDYRKMPFHVGPYVCLPFFTVWGALAYAFMRYPFLRLLRLISRMRKEMFFAVFLPLSVFLLFDLSMNCTYSFVYRAHMALW